MGHADIRRPLLGILGAGLMLAGAQPAIAASSTPEGQAMSSSASDPYAEMEAFATHVREVMFSADPQRIAALLDPSFAVWQNTDGYVFSGAMIDRFHQQLKQTLASIEFLDRKITPMAGGYIDQHVKRMVTKDGTEYLVPCVMVMSVRNGRLTGAREYMDSAQMPPVIVTLRNALAAELPGGAPKR